MNEKGSCNGSPRARSPKKAVVAGVNYARFEFLGLKLPSEEYAIAASQIADIFQFDQNQSSRAIKRLLGKGFQFDQYSSEIHPKKVNILLLEDFGKLGTNNHLTSEKIVLKVRCNFIQDSPGRLEE